MWPRLISRGRSPIYTVHRPECAGFNVAAADQPRKAVQEEPS